MIDRQYGQFVLTCDICSEPAEEIFDSFDEAVQGKKDLGWVSRKVLHKDTGWKDVCSECQKKGGKK